jgi:hypothetical protein
MNQLDLIYHYFKYIDRLIILTKIVNVIKVENIQQN